MANVNQKEMALRMSQMARKLNAIRVEAAEISKTFTQTPIAGFINGIPGNDDLVPDGGGLTKYEFLHAITMCLQLNNFFNNAAVAPDDYWAVLVQLISVTKQANIS